jgi:hypothetical protein
MAFMFQSRARHPQTTNATQNGAGYAICAGTITVLDPKEADVSRVAESIKRVLGECDLSAIRIISSDSHVAALLVERLAELGLPIDVEILQRTQYLRQPLGSTSGYARVGKTAPAPAPQQWCPKRKR